MRSRGCGEFLMLILFEQPQPVRRPSAAAATTTSKTRPLVVATAAAAGATVAAPLSGYVAATSTTISCVFLGGEQILRPMHLHSS